jgi:hypothetical protein
MADWATPARARKATTTNTNVFVFILGPPLKFLNTVVDLEPDEVR